MFSYGVVCSKYKLWGDDQWIKRKIWTWKQKAPYGTSCIAAHRIPVRFRGSLHVYEEQYCDPNFVVNC